MTGGARLHGYKSRDQSPMSTQACENYCVSMQLSLLLIRASVSKGVSLSSSDDRL